MFESRLAGIQKKIYTFHCIHTHTHFFSDNMDITTMKPVAISKHWPRKGWKNLCRNKRTNHDETWSAHSVRKKMIDQLWWWWLSKKQKYNIFRFNLIFCFGFFFVDNFISFWQIMIINNRSVSQHFVSIRYCIFIRHTIWTFDRFVKHFGVYKCELFMSS